MVMARASPIVAHLSNPQRSADERARPSRGWGRDDRIEESESVVAVIVSSPARRQERAAFPPAGLASTEASGPRPEADHHDRDRDDHEEEHPGGSSRAADVEVPQPLFVDVRG